MKKYCHDCCFPQDENPEACGCCEGVAVITPESTYNRPGLSAITYRIGTHGSFLETMIARLAGYALEKPDEAGNWHKLYPLKGLTTRDPSDPSLAMLDAWATVADVLTFYQERIANEGYLRTAIERRSILEMARLVGYKPRPGVAASVFLAYTLDKNHKEETVIPAGSRVQSIPGPDELPQTFETSDDLKARAQWNNLKPRMSRPQTQASILTPKILKTSSIIGPRVYLKGISTNLRPNDPLLIELSSVDQTFFRIKEVISDATLDKTLATLQVNVVANEPDRSNEFLSQIDIIKKLTLKPSQQPASTFRLSRKLDDQFSQKAGNGYRMVSSFVPQLQALLPLAVSNAKVTSPSKLKVFALRVDASLFGHNAPREPQYEPATIPGAEFSSPNPNAGNLMPQPWPEWSPDGESSNVLYLDRAYDQISPDSYIVIDRFNETPEVFKCTQVDIISRSAYGISGEVTQLTLNRNWWEPDSVSNDISEIRTTKVYVQAEVLELAEEPIEEPIGYCENEIDTTDGSIIELDGFYEGLESGRWVIVSGEREIEGTSGVRYSELAMISTVTQDVASVEQGDGANTAGNTIRPDEKIHTFIKLATQLAYCFKRDTVTIHGNVVKATHGETRQEILGSGDGAKSFQSFELKQFPLTHVAASNPTGVDSTLKLFVNDVQWHESDSLVTLQKNDRQFITKTNNADKTTIIFGNGQKGARLPTGSENIKAEYRNGIGKPGNVKAEQISLLMTKPLGVKEVINPLRASGGANRETRDQARKNVPLAIKALDRLVSVQDYEDFTRVYAGIGKSHAVELSNGRQQLVHVTIAGAEDIPIDKNSDLYQNLRRSLHEFGDPYQAIKLDIRELMFIVIQAGVAVLPDYQWESVEPILRQRLLDAFSFERQELGQDVVLSDVISVMQSVQGVAYVDVDAFGGIPEKIAGDDGSRRLLTPDEISEAVECLAIRWPHKDMDMHCSNRSFSLTRPNAMLCEKFTSCQKYGHFGEIRGLRQRLHVNLAQVIDQDDIVNRHIRPAQIAFLTPDVEATLILNQIERLS